MAKLRQYETTYILQADLDGSTKEAVADRVKTIINEQFGGEILRVDEWGRRTLAYPINKSKQGFYVYNRYTAPAECIAELERILRLQESVMKFLTVRLADDEGVEAPAEETAAAEETAEA